MEPWIQNLIVEFVLVAAVGVAAVVGVFLLLRSLFLWYWRVNEALAQLAAAAESLRAIHALFRAQGTASEASVGEAAHALNGAHGSTPPSAPAGDGSTRPAVPVR